jgi:hypothetical protein
MTIDPEAPLIVEPPAAHPREALLDEMLTADVADRLLHDRRTSYLRLRVVVRGGVAHVTGEVGSTGERAVVSRLVRSVSGIYAAWDLLRLPGQQLEIADIGCGSTKQVPSAIGVDSVPHPGVDIVSDLDADPLPFDDESLDHVFAVHVLEHLMRLPDVMCELHRVLRPGGVLHVLAPHWRHVNAVADPTHVRLIDVQTFKHFCEERSGVLPWRPLIVTANASTVHADLSPVQPGEDPASAAELARWFA